MACDIGVGSVTVSTGKVTCNTIQDTSMETVIVTGTSKPYRVEVTNSNIRIIFQNINVNTTRPVAISASSATIVTTGMNTISSMGAGNAGIECSLNSKKGYWREKENQAI
jgi:hypothetical protein